MIVKFIQLDQKLKKRANIIEKRVSAKVSGRERLNVAKNNTAQFLKNNLKGKKLPTLVRELLLKPWANVLILSELRQQMSPQLLKNNQSFVINLINAATPNSPKKVSKTHIKSLCAQLSKGLKLVAFDIQNLQIRSKQLQQCLEKINDIRVTNKPIEYVDPKQILKLSTEFNQESSIGKLIDSPDLSLKSPTNIPVIDDSFNEQSLNIKLGEWIQINTKDKPQRVKLSWKSPISGKLLFVNSKGAKVIDIFPIELAEKLRNKEFLTMQQVPLIDRAMSSIANKMKKKGKIIN